MSKRLINSVVVVLVTLAMGIVSGCGGTSGNGSGDTNSKGTGGIKASLDWSKVSATTKSSSNMPSNVASIRITLSSPTMDTIEQTFDALSESGTIDNVPAGSDITVKASALDGNGNVLFEGKVENVTVHAGEITDVAAIIMWPPNDPPVAYAGEPREVKINCAVQLDGRGSYDPNGDDLTYQWSFASRPDGSNAEISASDETGATANFTPDVLGTYVVNLVVNDGRVDSAGHSVIITASNTNAPPVANAGPDQSVCTGATVTLDGSLSYDPDGDALTYEWSMSSSPLGSSAALSNPLAVKPTFVPDLEGTYTFNLTVKDGSGGSMSTVNVEAKSNSGSITIYW